MKKYIVNFSFGILASATLFSCQKDDVVATPTIDASAILSFTATDVITKTYISLDDEAQLLVNAIATLKANPTSTNLEICKTKWRDARKPWEQSEGFLFGPVDTKGIDPSIDSWPVNVIDLDAVLASNATLTKTYIEQLEGTLKGFHTMEYLLFGTNGNKKIDNFSAREFEYLVGVSQSFKGATLELKTSWTTEGENYANKIVSAGQSGNSVYISQKSALEELVAGIVTIADEVANGKINDPFVGSDLTLEESQFSDNSKVDFADNMISIQNIYLGKYAQINGAGINDLVLSKNPNLDARIQTQITLAITSIQNIPGTFSDAIFNNRPAVAKAQEEVRKLQTILEQELTPLISGL